MILPLYFSLLYEIAVQKMHCITLHSYLLEVLTNFQYLLHSINNDFHCNRYTFIEYAAAIELFLPHF